MVEANDPQPTAGILETFENPNPERDYTIEIEAPEFTCVCPRTGHPDFATLLLTYVPDKVCVELKSLKLYLQAWRSVGIFHEAVTNLIANHLIEVLKPRSLVLEAEFHAHGGISTTVTVEHNAS